MDYTDSGFRAGFAHGMRDGDDYWLIDMAPAERSAYYGQTVPEGKRRPMMENWIPELEGKH